MFKRNLWKLVLSLAVIGWSIAQLIPANDVPFVDYIRSHATAKQTEFSQLVDEAAARKASLRAVSEFVALKQIGKERKLDLTQYFPDINIERSLQNIEKRNDILLGELLRRSKSKLQLGLDLAGGVAFTLEAVEQPDEDIDPDARQEKLNKAIEIIGERINGLGVAEPIIRPVGDNRIEIQLPGISTKDNPDVVDQVKAPARLDFRMVHPNLNPGPGVDIPAGYEIKLLESEGRAGETYAEEVFVKRIPEMTGEMVANSYARPDLYGRPEVLLEFTSEGSDRFAEVTRAIAEIGRRGGPLGRLAIVLDGKLYSAPTVREEIMGGSAQITGSFSDREAMNLANVLNNPLDVELQVMEQYEVGPTLAADAVISGRNAFIFSTLLTIAFMVVFYTVGGAVAAVGMGTNVIITLGVMSSIGATLTMPGIAGIVLTLAMSVDANILIFERMREELKAGKSLGTALEAGFDKAWSAILDSNVTTFLIALIMIALGTGAVKGFGVTLAIGIFSTMFAAIVVSKLLLEYLVHGGLVKSIKMFSILENTSVDFLRYARPAFITSWIIVFIGLTVVVIKGRSVYGIDFLGGDMVTLTYQERLDPAELERAANAAGVSDVTFAYQQPVGSDTSVLKVTTPFDQGRPLVENLQRAFPNAGLDFAGETRIGPSVGKEIQYNAAWSVFWSLLVVLLYVAFRFEFGYGIGAVVATMHDLLITIGFFVLFDRQFNAAMVAAILLIVGYSINDTIVIFDRIREEMKLNPTGTLREIVNRSLNLTLARTIITGGTTLVTAIILILVTSGEVNDIAFTLLIGVLTGTFSSLFIASPVFFWWHKGDRRHVEAHHDIAPKYEWQGTSKAAE